MKYLNLFIFVLLLAGCNQPVKHSDIIQADIMVSIIPQEDTTSLSALFSKCEIVKLNDIVLASINKVLKYDSLWIVQGKSDQGGVHLFNNEGRYLKTVLKWGEGPEEAYDVWSIKLLDGSIYLLINSGTEVVEYSLQKQKMVERFRLPSEILSATDFVVDNGGNYIFLKSISREKKRKSINFMCIIRKGGQL
ncbi:MULTISPECIES: 6-bladed beta-propeller [Bacteroides]|uniref:6-bladed beta-propeller n=1 Tax=Bacteroides TaxID=816 RepID=UPI001E2D4B2A|nr:6-bladed beta-propeller [Bacteroides fragilis]